MKGPALDPHELAILRTRHRRAEMNVAPNPTFWLTYFLSADLLRLTDEEWEELQASLVYFAGPEKRVDGLPFPSLRDYQHRPSRPNVKRWQRKVREIVLQFLDPKPVVCWRSPHVTGRRVVMRFSDGTWGDGFESPKLRDRIWAAVAEILRKDGPRIRRCDNPTCRTLFPATWKQIAKGRAYCRRKCSQTVRTRAYREKHSERVKKARRARDRRKLLK